MILSLPVLFFAATASSVPMDGPTQNPRPASILKIVNDYKQKHGLAAVICGVWDGDRQIAKIALGNSMVNVPASTEQHFRVGGVTLTCVSIALLRMVDQKKISLDDKLAKWYPKIPNADKITLRMLANCSAGVPDFVPIPAFYELATKEPFKEWTSDELINIALTQPFAYEPGQGWYYSHTNFVILGEIMQKVAQKPMREILRDQIWKPLGLKQTSFPSTPEIQSPVLHSFSSDRGVYEDSTFWNPSWTSFSGRMISSLEDLGKIGRELGKGSLLSSTTRFEQVAPLTAGLGNNTKEIYYGLGIILINGWMAQNPRFGGYNMLLANLPYRKLTIVVSTTVGPKSEDIAHSTRIWKELAKELAPSAPIPDVIK